MFWNKRYHDQQQRIAELERQLANREQELEKLQAEKQGNRSVLRYLLQQIAHKTSEVTHFSISIQTSDRNSNDSALNFVEFSIKMS